MKLNRRQILKSLSLCAAGGGSGLASMLTARRGFAQAQPDPKFLIVIAGAGGASMIDSFLAIRASDAGASAPEINTFPDNEVTLVADSPFRAVSLSRNSTGAIPIPFSTNQTSFVTKHKQDLMVVTQTGTSVNHTVAQKRAISGNDAWNGRTLQEAVAAHYGAGFPIPNVNMAAGGYIEPGIDRSIPSYARAEPVAQAALWPLSLDGSRGLKGAPSNEVLALARQARNQKLEPESGFVKTFNKSDRLSLWFAQRDQQETLQTLDLITKLNVFPDAPPQLPLSEYGLMQSPDGAAVLQVFPNLLADPLEAQAALAFLLIKHRVSVTVTIAPSFNVLLDLDGFPPQVTNPPLAFDFSHQSHRAAQAVMWGRILGMADRLSDLLKGTEFANGESLWDRTLVYFASDFGRTKRRPAGSDDFGTSHDLNNGYAILSPLANGNRVLGGVDPTTALTYGFDPETGDPDPGRTMQEREIYAGILHALDVDTSGSGLIDMRAMRKNA